MGRRGGSTSLSSNLSVHSVRKKLLRPPPRTHARTHAHTHTHTHTHTRVHTLNVCQSCILSLNFFKLKSGVIPLPKKILLMKAC